MESSGGEALGGIVGLLFLLGGFGFAIAVIAGIWMTFSKAGQPGWAAIIPIYNVWVMLQIAGKPGWWLILYFIPCVNVVMPILVSLAIAEKFGKGAGFGLGLAFLPFIFYPILGFGDAQYQPGGTT